MPSPKEDQKATGPRSIEEIPWETEPKDLVAKTEAPERASYDKKVYFIKSGTQDELRHYLQDFCNPLLGSNLFVSRAEGDLYYISWPDLPKKRILPETHIQISKTGRGADIYARHTRYTEPKLMVIKKIRKDRGSVEAAIRAFDYILEGTRGKEDLQAQAIQNRAYQVLDLFKDRRLVDVSPKKFRQAERKTYALLRTHKIDPESLVNKLKDRMVKGLLKGETGKDVTGRLNWLVSVGALGAAYRAAVERRYGLGPIAVKYVGLREAAVLARQFSRTIFEEVIDRLRPEALPAHELFKYPEKKVRGRQLAYVSGMLGTMIHQLDRFLRVKPYKPVGKEVAQILAEVKLLTIEGRRAEARVLLLQAHKKLVSVLDQYKYVYPKEKIY